MKIIEAIIGSHIQTVAEQLVANAPARAYCNDTWLRARYRTTRASDIVAQYWRLNGDRYPKDTPESRRKAAYRATQSAKLQAAADACVAEIQGIDFDDPADVLRWMSRIEPVTDDVDVVIDKSAIVATFAEHGWGANANCEGAFDGEDSRNVAGWIVGQWLANGHPMVSTFAERWHAKFGTPATVDA